MNQAISIRSALPEDWPAIWQFMQRIVAAGETCSWEQDISEAEARRRRFHDEPPGRTFVAVDADGTIVGSAESEPNHGGPAAHVATASFMDQSSLSLGGFRSCC
jgi:hypothetical protein